MKRACLYRLVVALVVVVVAGVPMLPGQALGTVVLTGETLSVYLSRIVYESRVASANTVTFEYVPGLNDVVCGPEPVSNTCAPVEIGPDRFVFTEVFAEITGAGLCTNLGPQVGTCAKPAGDLYFPNAAGSLPVVIRTKELNDQITAVMLPLDIEFAFTIDSGSGNDVITLVDNTGHTHGGADSIFCGEGNDRVTTNSDVYVAPDCEQVTRLT